MATITHRVGNASNLTAQQVDDNFDGVNADAAAAIAAAAAAAALAGTKQATLVSGTNIKTVGGVSLLGSGDVPGGGVSTYAALTDAATAALPTTNGPLAAALALLATLASPALSGTPTAPTAAPGTNTTQLATTAFTRAEIAALIASSPATLDTLNEIAAALGNDPNFAATMTTQLGLKANAASPTFTGIVTTNGAQVVTPAAMAALVVDVTKPNTKTIAVDSTITASNATPTAGTWVSVELTNSDTNPHTITFWGAFSQVTQAIRTNCPIAASGFLLLWFEYTGTAWRVYGDSGFLNNYVASVAPAVTDDNTKGYGTGSFWYNATGNALYICETAATGAAVWTATGATGVTVASGKTLTVNNTLTLAGTDGTTLTFPAVSATLAALGVQQSWTKSQAVTPVPLTDAATVAVDASLSNNFTLTLAGNRTLGAPTNLLSGMSINIEVVQDGTGSRTLAYNAIWTFPGGAPTLSTAIGAVDVISGIYYGGTGKIRATLNKAFA